MLPFWISIRLRLGKDLNLLDAVKRKHANVGMVNTEFLRVKYVDYKQLSHRLATH